MFRIDKDILRYIVKFNYDEGENPGQLFEDLSYSLDSAAFDLSDAISVCADFDGDVSKALEVVGEIAERAEENAENAEIIYNTFMNVAEDARLFEVLAYYDKRYLPAQKRKAAIKRAKEAFAEEMTEDLDDPDGE